MEYTLDQILDINVLQSLQDKLNAINPFPSALIDVKGRILTATAWQDICTKFHRINPESEKECIISDQWINRHLDEANPSVTYKCPNGLVDNAIPIIIEGHHLANYFTGQFFLEPPDLDFFRAQAIRYGFDMEAYLEAVKKVPVWTIEQTVTYLDFIKSFTESLALQGLTRLREIESTRQAAANEQRFRTIIEDSRAGYFFIDSDGIIRDVNDTWVKLYKYDSREEIVGHHFSEIQQFEDKDKAQNFVQHILNDDPEFLSGDFSRRCKDGSIGYHSFSARPLKRDNQVIGIEGFIIDSTGQRIAEIERDLSSLRLASVFNSMVEGFALHEIVCDDQGVPVDYVFLDANPAFENITGMKAREIIGKRVTEVMPGLDFFWIERYGKVALTGEAVTFEHFDSVLNKHFSVTAFSNKTGQFATIFDDITQRVASENELRESEVKYRQLTDLTPEGILIHTDGAIIFANNSAARILKARSAEDVIGRRIMDFVHQDYKKAARDRMNIVSNHGTSVPVFEEKLLRMNGEPFFSEVSAVPFELSGRNAVQVIFNDITDRKVKEADLKTLAQAIDSIKECVSMTDSSNSIIFVNQAFCNTYGYSHEELVGQNISMVRSANHDNGTSSTEILSETLGGGWSGEVINRKKDGTNFPVHISTAIIKGDDEIPLALIGIATDITERRKNQEELIAAKEKAEESDRLKSASLANISHEIRTPMNSILGFTELLEDMVEDPQQLDYLSIISKGGQRLLNIINAVIDIAKIEAGQVTLVMQQFDLNELLLELYELNKMRNTAIEFICDPLSPEPLMMNTDKTKLFQIVNNLLSNALKFTRSGSVHFGYTVESESLRLYVKDTGIGIPPEFKTKVFQRFRKVDLHDRTDYEGTGLGLAITAELVSMLKGEISFESEAGQGTLFIVKLPI